MGNASNMNIEKELESLKGIRKIDAPPFLYTRILNTIQKRQKEIMPVKWVLAAVAFLILVFAINITAINASQKNKESDLTEIFALKSQNMFYNE